MQTEKNGQIVRRTEEKPGGNLIRLIEQMKPAIASALPRHLTPERMARVALTALRTTPGLMECTRESFAAAIMACSALGLEPNNPLGQAYLIPFNNRKKGTKEVQLIIGYQGEMDLVRRSGQVSSIQAFPVFKNDDFSYQMGLHPELRHVPGDSPDRENPSNLTHVYAIARLKDPGAEPVWIVLTRNQIERSRKRGASGKNVSTPWDTDYVPMALKTAIRALFKWAPRSAEMATAEVIEHRSAAGAPIVNALPEESVTALLSAGITTEEEVAAGEVVDAEFEEQETREPGQEG